MGCRPLSLYREGLGEKGRQRTVRDNDRGRLTVKFTVKEVRRGVTMVVRDGHLSFDCLVNLLNLGSGFLPVTGGLQCIVRSFLDRS